MTQVEIKKIRTTNCRKISFDQTMQKLSGPSFELPPKLIIDIMYGVKAK